MRNEDDNYTICNSKLISIMKWFSVIIFILTFLFGLLAVFNTYEKNREQKDFTFILYLINSGFYLLAVWFKPGKLFFRLILVYATFLLIIATVL